jgi:hypothetical protein
VPTAARPAFPYFTTPRGVARNAEIRNGPERYPLPNDTLRRDSVFHDATALVKYDAGRLAVAGALRPLPSRGDRGPPAQVVTGWQRLLSETTGGVWRTIRETRALSPRKPFSRSRLRRRSSFHDSWQRLKRDRRPKLPSQVRVRYPQPIGASRDFLTPGPPSGQEVDSARVVVCVCAQCNLLTDDDTRA